MKTDLEVVQTMFEARNIEHTVERARYADDDYSTVVRLEDGMTNVTGYLGFYTAMFFNAKGELTGVGAYE